MFSLFYTRIPTLESRSNARVRWLVATRRLGVAVLVFGISGWAVAQTSISTQTLTLEAALRIAEARSQALPAQNAAAASAREMALAAGRLPDPTLRLSVDNVPSDGSQRYSLTDSSMTMRSISLTQTFTREGKRLARTARFEREADAALATRTMRLSDMRRSTATAWFDRYYQQQMVDLLRQQHDEAALLIEAADTAYRAGRGAQADVFMARSAVRRIDDRIREAQARLLNASITLTRWVGNVGSLPLGSAPLLTKTRLVDHVLEHQLDQHPDIALMTAQENLAQAEVEMARQDKSADWSASLMYSQRGPNFSNLVSVGISIPLQWDQKNRQDRQLTAKLAKVEQVRDEREEMVREHLAITQRWLTTWRSDLARLDDYDAALIPLASDRARAVLAAFRGGKASLSAVLDARRMEIDTRIERLRIEMETAGLWTELEYLIPDVHDNGISAPHVTMSNTLKEQQ